MRHFFKLVIVVMAWVIAGCGGTPVAVAPQGPSAAQQAAAADLEKQKAEIAEQRESLQKEQDAFRMERQQAEALAAAKLKEILAASASFQAATKEQEEKRNSEEAAFAEAEAKRKYTEDLVRLGSMNAVEKLQVASAIKAFKGNAATRDQMDLLLQFHEFRDAVVGELARRGAGVGALTAPSDTKPSAAARKAYEEMKKPK